MAVKGEWVAVQARKNVFVYERRTQKLLATMPGDSNTGLGFASSGELLITAPRVDDKVPTAVVLWDPRTGKEQSRIELSSSHRAFALSPDDRTIAIGGDGRVDRARLCLGRGPSAGQGPAAPDRRSRQPHGALFLPHRQALSDVPVAHSRFSFLSNPAKRGSERSGSKVG